MRYILYNINGFLPSQLKNKSLFKNIPLKRFLYNPHGGSPPRSNNESLLKTDSYGNFYMKKKGFALMELMVVLVLIGIIIAFILPRMYRTSLETKYQLLRQTCTELAGWANEWAEKELEIQPSVSVSTLNNYMETLGDDGSVDWIAASANSSNWQGPGANPPGALQTVADRGGSGVSLVPNTGVREIMPLNKILTNPFNGLSVFIADNNPVAVANAVTGAVGCAYVNDAGYNYFALIFQGADSIGTSGSGAFYAGQDEGNLSGLRNGIFMARPIR